MLVAFTLGIHLEADTVRIGNADLTLNISKDGTLSSITSLGNPVKDNPRALGPLFRVELAENVFGLEGGSRRVLDLVPTNDQDGLLTLRPSGQQLPEFKITTIDKGSYFVLKLVSLRLPEGEHAIEFIMTNLQSTTIDWLPLDSVTKKTKRRDGHVRFCGVEQRSEKNPLGSIAMWARRPDKDNDSVLYAIWTSEAIPHPKVDGERKHQGGYTETNY